MGRGLASPERRLRLLELQKDVPWWALSLLHLEKDSLSAKVRSWMESGHAERVHSKDRRLETWDTLRRQANELAEQKPLEWWRDAAWKAHTKGVDTDIATKLRHAALRSERAFVQIVNLSHQGKTWELADFHVEVARAMRQSELAAIFMPLEHGKSAENSLLIPLMDWAEWPDATECRVYWNQSNLTKWIGVLMEIVEYGEELHQVFPWIRRPTDSDRARHWSTDGFSIGGRTNNLRSFEVLTARGHSTGNRYSRTGCDDWVNSGNASSTAVQDGLEDYLLSGPVTFAEYTDRPSQYGTRWGTTFYCGTFFDRRDVGYRFYHWCIANGYDALKYDVYPLTAVNPDHVLWQEGRPPEYIEKMKTRLRRMFNKRMRNIVVDEEETTFLPEDVEAACNVSLNSHGTIKFGKIPDGARTIIGFDPAAGVRTRQAADPAICLYSEVPDLTDNGVETGAFTAHFVAWEALHGQDFHQQCMTIMRWAEQYMVPVVIEKNTLQGSYKSYLEQHFPHIKVYDHQTGAEKWDADDGIETFSPLFANKRAVIHAYEAPDAALRELKTQLTDWPQPTRKDLMMAFWFARCKMRKRQNLSKRDRILPDLPDYLGESMDRYWVVS